MAQDADSAIVDLKEVVLTAQRMETLPLQTPYSILKLSRKSLDEYGIRTTPEAMMRVNGVFIQKTNHGGGSPFIRGLTGNQVLLLVDGIRLNNSTFRYGPNQYLNTIDPYTVSNIEVAKGTGSVQYGTDALGGVLQVFTTNPDFFVSSGNHWSGKLHSRLVSGNMEKTGRGELLYSSNKLAVLTGFTVRDFGDLIGGDTTGRQSPSGYNEIAADFKLRYRLTAGWELIMAHQMLIQYHVPVYHKIRLENFAVNEMDPQQRALSYIRLRGKTGKKLFQQVEMTASWQYNKEGRNSQKNGSSTLRREQDKINTVGMTIDFSGTYSDNKWTAHSGMEFYHDRVHSLREDQQLQTGSTTSLRGLYPDGSGYGNYSMYSLHQVQFGRFIAMAGARFNLFDIRIKDTTLGKVQISPSALVGNAALLFRFHHHQSLYLSVSSGYRAPNVDDMGTLGIVDFRYEVPATSLQPEHSLHTELGYKYSGNKIDAELSLFYLKLKDIITRVKSDGQFINGYQVYQKENSEKAMLRGIEASINWQLVKTIFFSGSIAYAYGQNLSKNEPLRRVPPLNGRFSVVYRRKQLFAAAESFFASGQYRLAQGDKDDNRIPKGGTPGWTIFNLFAGLQLSDLRFNAGLQNIFNVDYRTHGSGINGAGRNIFLSVYLNLN